MPSYRTYEWKDYKISTRPTGLRRLLRFVPYLSGGYIGLVISIRTKSKRKRTFSYKWRLFRFDGKNEYAVGSDYTEHSYIENPMNEVRENIKHYLVTYGQYNLQLQLDSEEDGNTGGQVLAIFSFLERDRIISSISFSILMLMAGGFIVILVLWLIGVISKLMNG